MTIILHKFGSQWGIADPSPFCVKLESFLRINDIPYKIGIYDTKTMLSKAPKKKAPFIEMENGETIGDSNLIIQRLAKDLNIEMDKGLTKEQQAISHACRKMMDENLYFAMVYSRWWNNDGWDVIRPLFFQNMPPVIGGVITSLIRKNVTKMLYGQGIARHSKEEIYDIANNDLNSISEILGNDKWFFNSNSPTLLDLTCHAYIINIIEPPIENKIKEHTLGLKNLCDHSKRLQSLIYDRDSIAA